MKLNNLAPPALMVGHLWTQQYDILVSNRKEKETHTTAFLLTATETAIPRSVSVQI